MHKNDLSATNTMQLKAELMPNSQNRWKAFQITTELEHSIHALSKNIGKAVP